MSAPMIATDFRALRRGTLVGFFTLHLPSGITLHECSLHEKPGGARWVGLPGKPQVAGDGTVRRDANGKMIYTAIIEIKDPARRAAFRDQALRALDQLRGHAANENGAEPRAKPERADHSDGLSDKISDIFREGLQ